MSNVRLEESCKVSVKVRLPQFLVHTGKGGEACGVSFVVISHSTEQNRDVNKSLTHRQQRRKDLPHRQGLTINTQMRKKK